MNETTLQYIQFFKIIWLAGFALLYGLGGINRKWLRRYLGSFYLTLGIIGFSLWTKSFSFWYLVYWPLLFGSLTLGYGADDFWEKVSRRALYGLAIGFAAFPLAWVTNQWTLYLGHIVLCIGGSIFLGVYNPYKGEVGARKEETTIATISGLVPIMMV